MSLTFIPLGGSGEIGMNLNLYGLNGRWIMVDCGISFADERFPDIDIIMPDPEFITNQIEKLDALVLTHAHEDHLGAIQYLWPQLRCPVYATGFARSVLVRKLSYFSWGAEVPIEELPLPGSIKIGEFEIETLQLTHSIPEMAALVLRAGGETVLHTGDWKFDHDPIIGETSDKDALAALKTTKNIIMVCDSTNVFVEDQPISEGEVGENLAETIKGLSGRVIVTCFATNIARFHAVVMAAHQAGRRVALLGRSLTRILGAAQENGYLTDLPEIIDPDEALDLPDDKVLFMATGSQGEPNAALAKMAYDNHPIVKLGSNDTVLFSSRIIPGNERRIGRLQNQLIKKGIKLIQAKDNNLHVSGHPSKPELLEIYDLVKPSTVIPVHGELRHMSAQAALAEQAGAQAIIIENGAVVDLNNGKARQIDVVKTGVLALDGDMLLPLNDKSLKNKYKALNDGFVVATVMVDQKGNLAAPLQLSSMGVFPTMPKDLLEDLEDEIIHRIHSGKTNSKQQWENSIKAGIRHIARQETGKRPIVEVHLVEG